MIKLINYLPIIALVAASGCSSLPDKITLEEASKYSSITSLIENTIGWEPTWEVNSNDSNMFADILKPYRYAADYCAYEGGELVIGKATSMSKENPAEELMNSLLKDLPYSLPSEAIGVFECKISGKTSWAMKTSITNIILRRGITKIDFKTKIETLSPEILTQRQVEKERLDRQQAERMAQYKRAKEKERQEIERRRLEAERLKRENAKIQISHDYNIGQQVCRDGNVKYSYFTGIYIMGHPSHRNTSQPARLLAFLEGFSSDGYRIKIRISGWAPIGRTAPRPSEYPRMDGVVVQPGIVQWDDVKEWYLCRLINHH